MKIILLNGAPGSGKDTAAEILIDFINKNSEIIAVLVKLASPLKKAVHCLFGLNEEEDRFEWYKDKPHELLDGYIPRDLYISLSEKYVKVFLNQNHFVKQFIKRAIELDTEYKIDDYTDTIIVCSDLGFEHELSEIINSFGKENVFLLQIKRPGYTFKNDSRNYVESSNNFKIIQNDSDKVHFGEGLIRWVHSYLESQYGKKY